MEAADRVDQKVSEKNSFQKCPFIACALSGSAKKIYNFTLHV
jgi:hypothetical protein